jgi:hypothetical protein
MRTKQYLAGILLFLFLSSASSDVPEEQVAEVEHLLNYLADSDCRMIRNGKSYGAKEGAKHMRRKYNYFRDEIFSTEGFIEYAGTKSTRSDRLYEVLCVDQEREFSRDWLLAELKAYRNKQGRG